MCFPYKERTQRDTYVNALFGLFLVAAIVALAILTTADTRPSIEYSYHKSELLNWGAK